MIAARVHFGCVLADAGYGLSAPFRQGLTARGLAWAVGIPRHLKVYPVDVQLIWPIARAAARLVIAASTQVDLGEQVGEIVFLLS